MTIEEILPLSILNPKEFRELFHDPVDEFNINKKSNLYLHTLQIKDGSFNLDGLYDQLENTLLGYVCSRQNLTKGFDNKSQWGLFVKNVKKKLKTPDPNAGEGGELLLYAFLEEHLHAPKILSKMEIKTSSEHYVNGSDGIHILESSPNKYQLIFGESKMYADVRKGVKSAFESMGKIKQEGFGFDTWLMESEILKEIINPDKIKILESILLPSTATKPVLANSFGVFIGYEIDLTDYPLEDHDSTEIENHIRKLAKETIVGELQTIKNEIKNRGLGGHHFHVYALPFLKENKNGSIVGIKEVRFNLSNNLKK